MLNEFLCFFYLLHIWAPSQSQRSICGPAAAATHSFNPLNLCSVSNFALWHRPVSRAEEEYLNVGDNKGWKEAGWSLLSLNFCVCTLQNGKRPAEEKCHFQPAFDFVNYNANKTARSSRVSVPSACHRTVSQLRHRTRVASSCLSILSFHWALLTHLSPPKIQVGSPQQPHSVFTLYLLRLTSAMIRSRPVGWDQRGSELEGLWIPNDDKLEVEMNMIC